MGVTNNDKKNIRWVFEATKGHHGIIVLLSVISVVSSVLRLWNAILLKSLVDAAVSGQRELLISASIKLVIAVAAVMLLSHTGRYLS